MEFLKTSLYFPLVDRPRRLALFTVCNLCCFSSLFLSQEWLHLCVKRSLYRQLLAKLRRRVYAPQSSWWKKIFKIFSIFVVEGNASCNSDSSFCKLGCAPWRGEHLAKREVWSRSRSAVDPAGEHEGQPPRVGRWDLYSLTSAWRCCILIYCMYLNTLN